jgi:hypothetical protein
MPPPNLTLKECRDRFFGGLLPMLDCAFKCRTQLNAPFDVYKNCYGGAAGQNLDLEFEVLRNALMRLRLLEKNTGTSVSVQTGRRHPTLEFVWKKLNGNFLEEYTAEEQMKIARAFYHFKSRGRDAHLSPTKRVYIHSAGTPSKFSNGLEIMKLLLVDSLLRNPGFREAKIAGPAAPTSRRDTIVAYFSNPQALQQALDLIKGMPPPLFQPGVPHGVLPLDYIRPGVGGADEPVAMMIDKKPVEVASYGLALSDLVFRALTDANKGKANLQSDELKRVFLWNLLLLMEKGGVDPKRPYLMQQDFLA